jgi:hypothetical protein
MPGRIDVPTCSYELDAGLVIRGLGPGWDEAAIMHGARQLVSPGPVGRPLLMYLTDATTVHLYELLFERVAATRRPIAFPIRCDAPHVRRYLAVTIALKPAGGFVVSTLLTRAEIRPSVPLLAADVLRGDDVITVCSWCKRVNVDGRWVEVEMAVASLRLFERRQQPQVSHGICDACDRFMRTMLADDSTLPKR